MGLPAMPEQSEAGGVDILKKLNELSAKVESQQRQIEELKNLIKNK